MHASSKTQASPGYGRFERWSLALINLLQGALFAWASLTLPWSVTAFSLLAALLAVSHLAVAVSALFNARGLDRVWKLSALASLMFLLYVSWIAFSGGASLIAVYGNLGEGLFAAVIGIWGLFVLLTLPTACWGLARTASVLPPLRRWLNIGGAGAIFCLITSTIWEYARATPTPLPGEAWPLDEMSATLLQNRPTRAARREHPPGPPLRQPSPVHCPQAPSRAHATAVVMFRTKRDSSESVAHCVQSNSPDEMQSQLKRLVRGRAPHALVKIDWLLAHAPIHETGSPLDVFLLRPGLDGACSAGQCLMPWQLLSQNMFLSNQPLGFIKDLKFGVSLTKLREQLDGSEAEALVRIETRSFVATQSGLHELRRLRPRALETTKANLERATRLAETHIVSAQNKHGQFRYKLHPFSGKKQSKKLNLPRQAGTTLALCELGSSAPEVTRAIDRALSLLASRERKQSGGYSALTLKKWRKRARLGDSALPLIAFLACRERASDNHDPTIGRLSRLLLRMQREDGSFAPRFSLKKRQALPGRQPLYAGGQAVLALVLLEQLLAQEPPEGFPEKRDVARAIDRAFAYTTEEHWNHALTPFFFVEENWHCLAARAALSQHRNDTYEQFCLDYVKFKTRLILDENSGVESEFVGGFGFGNVVPPHNTGAAGFAEALAAAIAVQQARGESTEASIALLNKVMSFLLRQQWTEENCFACVPQAIGSWSEHTHSPITRIDFVQHAWAGLGHGANVTGVL